MLQYLTEHKLYQTLKHLNLPRYIPTDKIFLQTGTLFVKRGLLHDQVASLSIIENHSLWQLIYRLADNRQVQSIKLHLPSPPAFVIGVENHPCCTVVCENGSCLLYTSPSP